MTVHGLATVTLALAALAAPARSLGAQAGGPPQADSAARAYRPPTIALVHPAEGGSVPQDRPVIFLRFAPGAAADPLDLSSFRLTVDATDRTRSFLVGAAEAWGPIGPGADEQASPLEPGPHRVAARICSARGAYTALDVVVTVAAAPVSAAAVDTRPSSRHRLIDLLLEAARRLIRP